MGVLVFLASQWHPQPWNLPPDDPAKRLDRENNAWFTLAEAADLFATQKAPAINSVTEWIRMEPQEFEIVGRVWQRADFRPGAMLNRRVVTDHTELVAALKAYIRELEPALDKLCEAAGKPWCLDPADPREAALPQEAARIYPRNNGYGSHPGVGVMTAALINSAVTMSREGRGDGKPCEYVRAWLRLTQFLCPYQDMAYQAAQWSYAAETARRASIEQQEEMLAWLLEFHEVETAGEHVRVVFETDGERTSFQFSRPSGDSVVSAREAVIGCSCGRVRSSGGDDSAGSAGISGAASGSSKVAEREARCLGAVQLARAERHRRVGPDAGRREV